MSEQAYSDGFSHAAAKLMLGREKKIKIYGARLLQETDSEFWGYMVELYQARVNFDRSTIW